MVNNKIGSKFNEATKEALSHGIKKLRERCIDTYNIIENCNPEQDISPNNVGQKALSYLEGLRTQVQSSETVIPTDENLIINQFLAEMKLKNEEVPKLIAFTKGAILDVDNEIQRLETYITQVEEALNKPLLVSLDVSVQRVERARHYFSVLKTELHGLIQSIFKDDSDLVFDIIGQLMQERLNAESNDYTQVTDDTFRVVELLKDIKIVSQNPYNDKEVKIAY
ncbi:uncharacterized protein [Maniola hyperantus]|uniref:uncharacterized protein n=1 Tax=Aphantopus hyperantus TaxID=2795564 RepID=UPI00156A0E9A|nr:uncharacterized protein LOC117990505 [Maniola hyperantus]